MTPSRRAATADGRHEAHRILLRVETTDAYATILLRSMPAAMEARERALATELVLGTLRWQGRLDFALAQFASRPLESVDPPLRVALRLGAYQILHLSRVPAAAAVNESVRLARRAGGRAGGGFVNAVLRALASGTIRWPDGGEVVERLAVELSHPEWLVRRWVARLGAAEAEEAMRADNRPAPLSLRPNLQRGDGADLRVRLAGEGIPSEPGRWAPGALRVTSGGVATSRAFREGRFYIQDEASQIVAALAGGDPGGLVADLCAAPGGKATALAEGRGPGGRVLAADRHGRRLDLVRQNAARLGLPLWAVVQDATRPALRPASLGTVLLDAPCSGTGVLRRQPEIRWRRHEEDIGRLAGVQAGLLVAAAELLRPGGILVYSVCSVEPEEGPEAVARLLAVRGDLEVVDPARLPAAPPPDLVEGGEPGPHLRTLPHRHDTDGFFAVVLRRRPGAGPGTTLLSGP